MPLYTHSQRHTHKPHTLGHAVTNSCCMIIDLLCGSINKLPLNANAVGPKTHSRHASPTPASNKIIIQRSCPDIPLSAGILVQVAAEQQPTWNHLGIVFVLCRWVNHAKWAGDLLNLSKHTQGYTFREGEAPRTREGTVGSRKATIKQTDFCKRDKTVIWVTPPHPNSAW